MFCLSGYIAPRFDWTGLFNSSMQLVDKFEFEENFVWNSSDGISVQYRCPEGMQKEAYEEWMSIDEDIPLAATITNLEICQAVCEQDQAIIVDGDNRDECVEENPPTNAEMRQALDILKRGVQQI
ncbi:hypothetical protein AVEN_115843-1 [Araneus ventricosus]|uniref:Uncharacterized protein n=1 Tax=Araneus ventricosus TaxID=182803 RepID=A0A4Y2IUZ0_ARAVE|nr:hypothetical protein AVEN_115843-1 [Araneus ventricosus]